jgi:hypothetical protein
MSNLNNAHKKQYFTVTDVSYYKCIIATCAAVSSTNRKITVTNENTKRPQGVIRFALLYVLSVTTPVKCWTFLLIVSDDCSHLDKFYG